MSWRLAGIAVVLSVSVCLGCRKAAKEVMEGAIESQIAKEGGKADVQIGEDSVSFKMQDKKGGSNLEFGANTQLPAGFPTDVPLYAKITLRMATSQKQNEMFFVQAVSSDTPDQIVAFYKQEAAKNGWEEQSSMDQGDQMKALTFKKAERNLQIIVAVTDEGTTLNINTNKDG
ncbi:MAG: hypothetical protein ACYC3X_18795 [Pirellulaceae bacterium]